MEHFSNSESLCQCDAFHQVWAQSDMVWEMLIEGFQDGGHLGFRKRNNFSNSESPFATMPPTKFQLNPTYGSRGAVENLKS